MPIEQFSALTEINLKGVAVYAQAPKTGTNNVNLNSAAIEIMTDFHHTPAITIDSDVNIDDANAKMISFGIRSLIVINSKGQVVGIVTASDILGEKPMRVLQQRGGRHQDITVHDVMTASDQLFFVHYNDLLKAKVGQVLKTLRQSGRQHTLVLEELEGNEVVRGIVSAAQIARQLGVAYYNDVARTFAEIENALK
jgi:signal-transduction protein with cAMP-binding, CBS, and nucleotidyltransferase domain